MKSYIFKYRKNLYRLNKERVDKTLILFKLMFKKYKIKVVISIKPFNTFVNVICMKLIWKLETMFFFFYFVK